MEEQQTEVEQPRRGPGRPPNPPKAAEATPRFDMITYIPDNGDPVRTNWNGVEFMANIPVKVMRSQTVLVPTKIKTPMKDENGKPMLDDDGKQMYHEGVLQPDGTLQTRMVDKPVPMVELAKGNCRFSVNGATPAVAGRTGSIRMPTDADEYRGFAMAWIAAASDKAQMDARWQNEESLRGTCGCTNSDVAYLMPFFEARRLLAKAA
jgi:hypothetical protein